MDTGLHRGGSDPADWAELVRRARALEEQGVLRVRGVWSHLARADEPSSALTRRQTLAFDDAVALAREAGLHADVLHLAGSAALLSDPSTHYDLARAGIALYGVEPIPGRRHGLRPAMTLRARVLMRRTVSAGAGVSYGHDYVTDRSTTLALVPMGYADGIPRAAGGRAEVLVGGARHVIAGRVAMDQFVVDAGDSPVDIGDEVIVFGPGTHGEPTVEDWAGWAGTNPHEILTGIGTRVHRRYSAATAGAGRVKVAVVFGGASPEHDVSCASGSAIIAALDPARYDVLPVLISPEGVWGVGTQHPPTGGRDRWSSLVDAMRVLRTVDVVVPALHGPMGEDGTLQGMLATLDVPFDRQRGSRQRGRHGQGRGQGCLPVPRSGESRGLGGPGGRRGRRASRPDRDRLGLPVFVKPARAGSSQGVTRVEQWADLVSAVETARLFDPKVLVEKAVMGREVDIAVLEHPDGRREAGPPLEITYAAEQSHFSFQAKYGDDQTVFEIPAHLDDAVTAELQRIALEVFDLLGCEGLLRVDFLLGEGAGSPVLNEVNTFPGFTTLSQFPQIWAAAGMTYPELVDRLVQTALSSKHRAAVRSAGRALLPGCHPAPSGASYGQAS